jgi:hypothetical protein
MAILRSPAVYIPDLKFGRPISLGFVYVLQSGISVPTNRSSVTSLMLEDVFYNDETGLQIQVSQPLNTTKGGVLYTGSPDVVRQLYTDASSYQVAVYSSSGALEYYDTMSNTFGGNGGGGSATIISDWNLAITAGFYQDANTAALNQPVPGRRFVGWVSNTNETGDSLTQYAVDISTATGAAYVRVRSLGIFGSWRQVWDSASFTRQSGALDNTAGAAMLVGAGGLVGNAVSWGVSCNSIALTGFYKAASTATDTPLGAAALDSAIIHINVDSVTAYQLFFEAGNGNMWVRYKSGSFGEWKRSGATGLNGKTSSYQVAGGDFGSTIRFSGGATATLTVVSGVGYDGGIVQVINRNSGSLTIAASGVTITWLQGGSVATGSRTVQQGSSCSLIRISSTEYELTGFGIS